MLLSLSQMGSYPLGKSPYGIEDLAGNVSEWVQDWYDEEYYRKSSESNPVNATPGTSRVLRGGGWYGNPAFVRAADRGAGAPDGRYIGIGFWCVVVAASSR
jgi:sulfatase modifying factor 1